MLPQQSSVCETYGTSISTHASMMVVTREESSRRLSTSNLVLRSRSHTCVAFANSPLARRITWLYLIKMGTENYGLCEPGKGERVDTDEP